MSSPNTSGTPNSEHVPPIPSSEDIETLSYDECTEYVGYINAWAKEHGARKAAAVLRALMKQNHIKYKEKYPESS